MPIVAMPDGVPVSFPDDMPKEQIAGLIASKYPDAVPKKQNAPTTEQKVGGLVGKVLQGKTVGLGDEMQAGIFAPATWAGNNIGGGEMTLSDAYDQELSKARGGLKVAEQEFPIGSTIAELAGGVLPGMGAYKAASGLGLTAAKTATGRRLRESALGAIGSGVYGFNTGEGGFDKRVENAKDSAIVGALMSPAIGFGLEKAGKIAQPLTNKISSALSSSPQRQSNALADQLKAAIESGDEQTKNTLLEQISAGKAALPYEVPMSKGNLVPTLQNQDIEEKALKGALGQEPQRIMSEFSTKQNQALRSNISALIRDNDLPANAVGDDIVDSVTKSYMGAKGAKTAAYNTAKPLMQQAFVGKQELGAFGNQMDEALAEFPSDIANRVKSEFAAEIKRADGDAVPFSLIENFRKKLNNLGQKGSPEYAAGMRVKGQLDTYLDSGIIQGEQGAVSAITNARKLSSELKRTYQTKQASPLVREIVDAVDNNMEIAPEKIFQSISTGNSKQNANNVTSLIKILGEDHPTVSGLRDSILKDVRDRATDASGFISPSKLAGNIDKLIYQNRTMANAIMSPNEVKTLKALQDVSRKIAYKAPGVVNNSNTGNLLLRQLDTLSRSFVGRNTPFFGSVVNSLKESAAANNVQKSIAPTIEAKPIFGGVGELLVKKKPITN